MACVVVAGDELDLLPSCLERLTAADQLLILDRGLSSQVGDLAAKYGAIIHPVADAPVAEAFRDHAELASDADWLFHVDPDELVSAKMFAELAPLLQDEAVAAYRLPYRTICFGRSLDHRFKLGQKLALSRRGRAHWGDALVPHREPEVDGRIVDLLGQVTPIDHLVYRSIDQALEKTVRYARHRQSSADPISLLRVAFRRMVLDEAWRDGAPGLAQATLECIGDALACLYAWERASYPEQPLQADEHRLLVLARAARRATQAMSRR